ncbi:glutamate receptor-interacting protein 1-like isoform X1 [Sycon ciliatum]|uniref:glutamate receptor-interacting protein 1-like isoform X1 n=1 Tax=Sycon ciliatum TaxID=27933 RepID=UPI0020AA92A1
MTKSRLELQTSIETEAGHRPMNDRKKSAASLGKKQKKQKRKRTGGLFACFAPQQPRDTAYGGTGRLPVSNGTVTRLGHGSGSSFPGAPGKYNKPVRTDIAYVELNRKEGESFGLIIAGGLDHGEVVTIADMREGGIAKTTELLEIGDRILAVNGTSTDDLHHDAVVRLLQSAGTAAYLEIEYDLPEGAPPPESATKKKQITVEVHGEADGFGFKLRGGVDEGLDRPLTIAYIRPGSELHKLGTVKVGDRLMRVNDRFVGDYTLSGAITALRESPNLVKLDIEYDVTLQAALQDNDPCSVLLVELVKPPGISLGLTLSGSPDAGEAITISDIRPGGIADRCGALHQHDRLLAINGRNLENSTLPEAVAMLLKAERMVTLEILPIHRSIRTPPMHRNAMSPAQSHNAQDDDDDDDLPEPPEEIIHDADGPMNGINGKGNSTDPGQRLWGRHQPPTIATTTIGLPTSNGFSSTTSAHHLSLSREDSALGVSDSASGQSLARPRAHTTSGPGLAKPKPPVAKRNSSLYSVSAAQDRDGGGSGGGGSSSLSVVDRHVLPTHSAMQLCRQETLDLELTADPFGYGFSISGGGVSGGPITVSSIEKDSPADRIGVMQVGDRIITINGTPLGGMNLDDVCKLIRESSGHMLCHLEFDVSDGVKPTSGVFDVRLYKNTTSLGLTINGGEGDGMWISQVKRGGVAYRSGLVECGDGLQAINGIPVGRSTLSEAAGMLRDSTDIVVLTICKKEHQLDVADDSVEFAVELVRRGRSLGITLNGSTLPGEPIYVSDIREDGVVFRTGALQKGDIILSINNQSLRTFSVPQAVRLLEEVGDSVQLKIQRTSKKAYSSDSDSQLSSLATASFPSPLRQSHDSWQVSRIHGVTGSDDDAISSASTPSTNRTGGFLAGSRGSQIGSIGSRTPAAVAASLTHTPGQQQQQKVHRRPASAGNQDYRRRWTEVPETSIAASLPTATTPTSTVRVPTRQQTSFSALPRSGTSSSYTTNSLTRHSRPPSQAPFSDAGSSTHSDMSSLHGTTTGHSDNSSQSSPQTTVLRPRATSAHAKLASADKQPVEPPSQDPSSLLAELESSLLDSTTFTSLLSTGKSPDRAAAVVSTQAASTLTTVAAQSAAAISGGSVSSAASTPAGARRSSFRQAVPASRSTSTVPADRHSLDGGSVGGERVTPTVQSVEMHVIELSRPGLNTSFGFSISDGLSEPGVYIRALMPGGIAMQQSKLKPLDRVLQINSTDVRDYDCRQVLPVLSDVRETLRLVICRCSQLRSMSGLASPSSFK